MKKKEKEFATISNFIRVHFVEKGAKEGVEEAKKKEKATKEAEEVKKQEKEVAKEAKKKAREVVAISKLLGAHLKERAAKEAASKEGLKEVVRNQASN